MSHQIFSFVWSIHNIDVFNKKFCIKLFLYFNSSPCYDGLLFLDERLTYLDILGLASIGVYIATRD